MDQCRCTWFHCNPRHLYTNRTLSTPHIWEVMQRHEFQPHCFKSTRDNACQSMVWCPCGGTRGLFVSGVEIWGMANILKTFFYNSEVYRKLFLNLTYLDFSFMRVSKYLFIKNIYLCIHTNIIHRWTRVSLCWGVLASLQHNPLALGSNKRSHIFSGVSLDPPRPQLAFEK